MVTTLMIVCLASLTLCGTIDSVGETSVTSLNSDSIETILKQLPSYVDLENLRATNRQLRQAVDAYAPGLRYHPIIYRECKSDSRIVLRQMLQLSVGFAPLFYHIPLNRISIDCVKAIALTYNAYNYGGAHLSPDHKVPLTPTMAMSVKTPEDFVKLKYLTGCSIKLQIVFQHLYDLSGIEVYFLSQYVNITGIELHLARGVKQRDALVIHDLLTRSGNRIECLNLNFNAMTKKAYRIILSALTHANNQVRELHLTRIRLIDEVVDDGNEVDIGNYGAKYIARVLKSPWNKLQVLLVNSNSISDHGATMIADSLQDPNCRLHVLDLKANKIDNDGAAAIASSIFQNGNTELNTLNLSYNKFSSAGVRELAKLLNWPNSRIRNLDLVGIWIDDSVVPFIIWTIRSLPPDFEAFAISMNNMSREKQVQLKLIAESIYDERKLRFR